MGRGWAYRSRRIVFCLALVFVTTLPSHAADTDVYKVDASPPPPPRPTEDYESVFFVSLENDLFSGQDNGYTNGVRAGFVSAENNIPNWLENTARVLPFFPKEGHRRWGFEAGQSMFTPDDITTPVPDPTDRPYAGWLYANTSLISDTGTEMDKWELSLGVVGPLSGAAESQKFVHKVTSSNHPKGWGSQLENEPAVMLSYEHKYRNLVELSPGGWGVDLTPGYAASLGNVYTKGTVGAVARFGYDLPSDYGPPLIKPGFGGSDFFIPSKKLGWYLFAGVDGSVVAQNIFLDGNTFRDSPRVEKIPWVGGLQAGVAFTYDGARLSYTHVFRSKEFKGQDAIDNYGAINLSWRF